MRLLHLHHRLVGSMALAALAAFAAGAGLTPSVLLTATALLVGLGWAPGERFGSVLERAIWVVSVGLFGWVLYVGVIVRGDVLPPSLALLMVLLAGETLRPLEKRNDFRLYALSFALLIAATAYYPGVGFGVAFVAYVTLATLALMVGHLRQQAERFRIADLRVGRSFLITTAALSGITVLSSVLIFLAFPRLPHSWLGQGRRQAGEQVAGFSETVSLAEFGGSIQANPEVMFRVEFAGGVRPEEDALHWRGLSFDHFDGLRWSRTPIPVGAPVDVPRQRYATLWGGGLQAYRVYGGPEGVRVLFGLHPVLRMEPQSEIRSFMTVTGDFLYRGWDRPIYSVHSASSQPPEELLRGAPEGPPPAGGRYLQLPRLDERVAQLADSLTRGHSTRLDRVRAVENWLREEFRYTLELPSDMRGATLEHFLFERRAGHCEYFSTAMAVLLRSVGIPTRNVNGFLGGEWSDFGSYLAVTGNNAHSWVEVWFPEVGWVSFDPTPAAEAGETLGSAGSSRLWPALLWMDALQFQWYRWVLTYDLEKQLGMLRTVSELFSGPSPAERGARPDSSRAVWIWIVGGLVIGIIAWRLLNRRIERRGVETRLYLALRRAYTRAGYTIDAADGPLSLLESLRQWGAPALPEAEHLVGLYIKARFAGEDLTEEERAAMQADLAAVQREVKRTPAAA